MTTSRIATLGALIALAGYGCIGTPDPVASEVQSLDTPPLVARSESIDFGAIAVGSTATRSVALLNNGTEVVDVTDVTYSGAFPPDPCRAVVIQPCVFPGQTTALEVTCAPTTAGAFSGRVAVRYHAGSEFRVLTVAVAGQAVTRTR